MGRPGSWPPFPCGAARCPAAPPSRPAPWCWLAPPLLLPPAANLAGVPVAVVGKAYDLTYPTEHLGEGADALDKLLKG